MTILNLSQRQGVLTCKGRFRLCWCQVALQTATQSTATGIPGTPPVLCGEEGEGRKEEEGRGRKREEEEEGGRGRKREEDRGK